MSLLLGFFGSGNEKSTKKTTVNVTNVTASPKKDEHITTITSTKNNSSKKNGIVLDEVQQALREEEAKNPLLNQLKEGGEFMLTLQRAII